MVTKLINSVLILPPVFLLLCYFNGMQTVSIGRNKGSSALNAYMDYLAVRMEVRGEGKVKNV